MKKVTIETITKRIEKAKQEYLNLFSDPAEIDKHISAKVNSGLNKMLLDVIGVEPDTWYGWRIKQHYGNGPVPPVYKYLYSQQGKEKVEQIVADLFSEVNFELTEKEKVSLRRVYREKYLERAAELIEKFADGEAEKDVTKLIDELVLQEAKP